LKIYQSHRKNFNFDKYCLAHVAEHNRYASLVEYGVHPLEESMKNLHFEDGIKDPTPEAARNTIMVDCTRFQDFDSVMHMYVTSKQSQKSESGVSPGRQISILTGGRGGGRGDGGAGRGGRSRGDPDARRKGLVSQADIDKVTTVENKHYPEEVYANTAAEKAKHWQLRLRNPGKERGTGPAGGRRSRISVTNVSDFATAISSAVSAISALSDTTKRANEEGTDDDPTDQSNRDNPSLACQQTKKTKPN